MRLLLTRAVSGAARTATALEAAGHTVVLSPVLEIVGLEAQWPHGVVDAVVATSGQAFAVPVKGLSPEVRRLIPLYVVGARTADQAQIHGFLGAPTMASNATMLAITLGKLPTKPKRLIYVAGQDRKPDLETALSVTEQRLEVLETYKANRIGAMTDATCTAFKDAMLDGVLHFSRRSAALFLEQAVEADVDITPLIHFCLSDDVAEPLREAGCERTEVAEAPNEAALLALVPRA